MKKQLYGELVSNLEDAYFSSIKTNKHSLVAGYPPDRPHIGALKLFKSPSIGLFPREVVNRYVGDIAQEEMVIGNYQLAANEPLLN
eukprot:XP_001706723.1 Hypothetical protein GL50803_21614 [Giardia lamblia ATCC 50803]